ncbi:N-acetyl-gamma-glutamyl-phosphate reductase [Thalassobacillus sp. C254]|uniref:N-acetyl-gamma-glutamyl-phosphate reductase n=1 Tax=Thalassobacillus sp. C254 TaxID=1225341 RepID=UPI0006D07299|nr:N-acetyl-gamma-glutamyl-phosphate reductase [Thalassobacillus sp. C254]
MRVAIIGATGYGGAELIRLLHGHPHITEITFHSSSQEGKAMEESYPHLSDLYTSQLQEIDPEMIGKEADIVFLSTPPGVSAEYSGKLIENGAKVIDLSGDLRLKEKDVYESWYERDSADTELLNEAVYGLTEWNREGIKASSLLSNPGCYPTATLLGLGPLVSEKLIDLDTLIIDAKSGTTGAGRSPSAITHFSEMNDNFKVYKVNEHKHIPEIEQTLKGWSESDVTVTFTPHLVPMTRGIMATMYGKATMSVTENQLRELYEEMYKDAPFIRIREDGKYPSTKEVYGTNYCDIGLTYDERTGRITIVSVIDNLVKGASGQAIQNMNLMLGFEENEGLNQVPVYP